MDEEKESIVIEISSEEDNDDAQSLSDLSSYCSSTSHITSVTDLSIYHEFDCLLGELYAIQESQHAAIEGLHRIQRIFRSDEEPITVYDEVVDDLVDFHDVIDQLHIQTMRMIENKEKGDSFTEQLLQWVDHISSDH